MTYRCRTSQTEQRVKHVDSAADPNTDHNASRLLQDISLIFFYQQQLILNHQLFIQQQQTLSALMGKVEGLGKMMENKSESPNENTMKHLPTIPDAQPRKTHVLSDVIGFGKFESRW